MELTVANAHEVATAIREAMAEAEKAAAEVDDMRGTCNFDTTVICTDRKNGAFEHRVNACLNQTPHQRYGNIEHQKWFYGYGVHVRYPGQGAKRTKFAETLRDELEARGIEATVHYVMD